MISHGLNNHGVLNTLGLNPFRLFTPTGLVSFDAAVVTRVTLVAKTARVINVSTVILTQADLQVAVQTAVQRDASITSGVFFLSDPIGRVVRVTAQLVQEISDE